MKALSKSDKLSVFIAPKKIYIVTFLDNNEKFAVYIGGDIHGIYRYLEMIGAPTTLTTSVKRYHHFSPSSSSHNDVSSPSLTTTKNLLSI